jgi:hypothetical protein
MQIHYKYFIMIDNYKWIEQKFEVWTLELQPTHVILN